MPLEDFTTYTKLDPNNRFTVTSNKVIRDGKQRNEEAWLYKNKGVGHFPANVGRTHRWNGIIDSVGTANNTSFNAWALTQTGDIDDWWGLHTGGKSFFASYFTRETTYKIKIFEDDSGSAASSEYGISADTRYWLEAEYDPGVGTYGTLYLRIFSDTYSTLLTTLSLALRSSKKAYDNVFSAMSVNTGVAAAVYGEAQDLDLMEAVIVRTKKNLGRGLTRGIGRGL